MYLDRPITGAEVQRYDRVFFLYLALICRHFVSVQEQYHFAVFCDFRFLLENLKVIFPFPTDIFIVYLTIS